MWGRSGDRRPAVTIEYDDGWLRVVRTESRAGRRCITRIEVAEVSGDAGAPSEIRARLLALQCWAPREPLRVLAPVRAMFFSVELPPAPREDLPAMAHWQAARHMGQAGGMAFGVLIESPRGPSRGPLRDLRSPHATAESGEPSGEPSGEAGGEGGGPRRVMVAAVSLKTLSTQAAPWLEVARGGCAVTSGMFGLYEWVRRDVLSEHPELSSGVLVIDIGAFVARLLIVDGEGLAAAREAPLSATLDGSWFRALIGEVKRIEHRFLEASGSEGEPGAGRPRPGRVVVTGLPHLVRVVVSCWHEIDDRPCRAASAWTTIARHGVAELADAQDIERRSPVALGRVVGVAMADDENVVDLVPDEVRVRRAVTQSRRALARLGGGLLLLLVVLLGGEAARAVEASRHAAAVRQEIAENDRNVRRRRRAVDEETQLAQWRASSPEAFILMADVLQSVPAQIELLEWTYDGASGRMTIRGVAGRIGTAAEWAEALQTRSAVQQATMQVATRRPPQASVEFVIVCDLRAGGAAHGATALSS